MDVSGEISTQKCEITKKTDPKIVPRATPACAPRIACHSLRIACHSLGDRPKAGRRPAEGRPENQAKPGARGAVAPRNPPRFLHDSSTIPPRFWRETQRKHEGKWCPEPRTQPPRGAAARVCRRETVTKPSPNRHVTVTLLAQKHKENMKDSQQKNTKFQCLRR